MPPLLGATIGISSSSIEPSVNHGIVDGIGHYTQQLITALQSSHIHCKKIAFPRLFKKASFQDSISMPFSFPISMLATLINPTALLKFNPQVDLFHCTHLTLIPMTCPTVITLHDLMLEEHIEFGSTKNRAAFVNFWMKKSLKSADHILAISEYTAHKAMHYYGIKENKISIVPLSAADSWFTPLNVEHYQAVLKKYHLPQNYFLSVGTIQPKKNFNTLIDAYFTLPITTQKEHPLVIIGKYGWNCNELKKKMQLLHDEQKIIWLNNVDSDDDLRCIYKGASVFVFPSLYEGFGIPLVEAFASEIPVISSNRTALPEISKGAALEVNPESVGELAEAMQLLVSDPNERSERIRLGTIRGSELRWQQTFEKTLRVYQQVLSRY